MLRKVLASLCLLLIVAFPAFSLSQEDYRELLKDSEFAAADDELKEAWDYAKNNLAPEKFDELKSSQREWAKNGRDESAEELIDFQGYSKVMAYTAVTKERAEEIRRISGQPEKISAEKPKPEKIQTGIISADKDYITVIAEGKNTDRKLALEAAYVDAVRLAVGAIISSKTELNNDELSEKIITHSRGVIEGFDILGENQEGRLTRIYIRAKVHKEILQDETKRYIEAQTVKADTGGVVKAQQNENAREVTTQAKQKSGAELLREVLESYKPEDFFTAKLNPKILYDKKTKKPYVQITEKFNQSLFWDEFLPKLRNALDGVAAKKKKQFYRDDVRKKNQALSKQGYSKIEGQYDAYEFNIYDYGEVYNVIVPDNVASFTVYSIPMDLYLASAIYHGQDIGSASDEQLAINLGKLTPEQKDIGVALLQFVRKMCRPFAYSITYLDKDGDVITVQIIKRKFGLFMVYTSFANYESSIYERGISFAPGYYFKPKASERFIALGTGNYNIAHPEEGYELEIDSDDIQRLDTMKFEVIFE